MKRSLPTILLTSVALLVLSGCHSKRSASQGEAYRQDKKEKQDGRLREIALPKDDMRSRIVAEASRWIGTPYCYGGTTRKGTDCSGMVMAVFDSTAGIKLPRNSGKQQEYCRRIKEGELAVADLVFFSTSKSGGRVNHVGLYVGERRFIHASSSRGVILSSLDEPYYRKHYHSAGRVPKLKDIDLKDIEIKTAPAAEAEADTTGVEITVCESEPAVKAVEKPVELTEPSALPDSIASEVQKAFSF